VVHLAVDFLCHQDLRLLVAQQAGQPEEVVPQELPEQELPPEQELLLVLEQVQALELLPEQEPRLQEQLQVQVVLLGQPGGQVASQEQPLGEPGV
jgi:hypothetical protein